MRWVEQSPDFRYWPLERFFYSVSFSSACAVALSDQVDVVIERQARLGIIGHLEEDTVELGGLLIGRAFDRGANRSSLVFIEGFARAEVARGTSVSLEMGTEVWEAARNSGINEASVVGWYHSHPNLGAFFSGTDRRTQKAFFRERHSIGLVVDPIRREEKWFIGPDSIEVPGAAVLDASIASRRIATPTLSPVQP